jgi:DNA invertase Pin-like site-specific DNA recombinase
MRIIGYVRVSTDQQVESGLGLEAQRKSIEKFAKNLNVTTYEIYSDEGVSGKLEVEDRPGILEAIASLTKGSMLVVAKRDRLGRDVFVVAMIERLVQKKGARIVSVAGEGTETDDPSSMLMRGMIDVFGQYERLIIGARTKAALKAKKDRGQRIGHIPFGKRLAEDGIHLLPDDGEREVLSFMSTLRACNNSIMKIANELNKHGKLNRGAKWSKSSVHRLLPKIA